MNRIPIVTKSILMINVLLFFGTIVAERYDLDLGMYLNLHFFLADNFNFAQLFTYMFMHANFAHIFFNMFAVWMFGSVLERFMGPNRFLLFYIVCGVGAGLVQEVAQLVTYYSMGLNMYDGVNPGFGMPPIPMGEYLNYWQTAGASGAVFGILLGFGMRFPNDRIFIFPIPFPVKAKWFVIGYAAVELLLGVSNNVHDNVAHFAHLGGMLFGLLLILYWKYKREW